MEKTSDIIGRKCKAASILVHIQPALLILTLIGYAVLKIVHAIQDSNAMKLGQRIPFREGGDELALFIVLLFVFAVGVLTSTAALIVRSKTKGWSKIYVLPMAVAEIILGAFPLIFVIRWCLTMP